MERAPTLLFGAFDRHNVGNLARALDAPDTVSKRLARKLAAGDQEGWTALLKPAAVPWGRIHSPSDFAQPTEGE
ncbi:hypothetical protein [Zoogloea sp. LCSB751]|uniref:hypothetical protein n=1 Tax=Zoogloea sp. LCSB751 TaxID=1965277 RepID=UPI0009A4AA0F|nr:hypothetical protein [Zoogloea sp. LCSB751]